MSPIYTPSPLEVRYTNPGTNTRYSTPTLVQIPGTVLQPWDNCLVQCTNGTKTWYSSPNLVQITGTVQQLWYNYLVQYTNPGTNNRYSTATLVQLYLVQYTNPETNTRYSTPNLVQLPGTVHQPWYKYCVLMYSTPTLVQIPCTVHQVW